ncbi:MAG: DUF6282 family protein [Thermodesulfobacteriota bacterium]
MSKSMNRENIAKVAETKSVGPLMQGAIDMHYHGYPEITLGVKARLEDVEILQMALDMGMRGIVIKSQMWPSIGRVYHLRRMIPGIECFSSIVLNSVTGGLNPWVVEAAARQGAKVVWLPTWSSSYKLGQGGFAAMMKTWFPSLQFEPGLCCVNSSGKVTADVQSIVRLAKEMDLVLCTGHISPEESLAVAQEAERIGYSNLIFTHPLSSGVGATLEQTKEMTRRGAYVELAAINIFYGSVLDRMLDFIDELGPAHCILSTDTFMEWTPPGPEFLRMFIGRLLVSGIPEESLKTMACVNPARLLGLAPLTDPGKSAR